MRVPIVRPSLGEEEIQAAEAVIRSGWIAQGPEVAAFECELAAAVGAPGAVAVSSCTAALELCLRALGIGPGDDVVTVSHSFIATANAVVTVGARPVFVDIDPATFGMDASLLEGALTPTTRAIVAVHQLGFPCDLPGILDIARKRGIPVIEDAACAIGSEIQIDGAWQRIGKPHGLCACFSFHPRKIITTGDGGMITTADDKLAERLRLLRQHGATMNTYANRQDSRIAFESFVVPATNARMTDLQAALARPQLARLGDIIATRRALGERYRSGLADHPILEPFSEPAWMRANFQSYPLRIRPSARRSQADIMQKLLEQGVASRRGVGNAHAEPAYAKVAWACGPDSCEPEAHRQGRCPRLRRSEEARDQTILIPLFHGMTSQEEREVLSSLGSLCD